MLCVFVVAFKAVYVACRLFGGWDLDYVHNLKHPLTRGTVCAHICILYVCICVSHWFISRDNNHKIVLTRCLHV